MHSFDLGSRNEANANNEERIIRAVRSLNKKGGSDDPELFSDIMIGIAGLLRNIADDTAASRKLLETANPAPVESD